jgi:hypothetical protein
MHTLMKELASENPIKITYKNVKTHYFRPVQIVPAPLFSDFMILFSS